MNPYATARDMIADLKVRDAGTGFEDDAGALMSQHRRERCSRAAARMNAQIRVTDAAGGDLDQHFTGARGL